MPQNKLPKIGLICSRGGHLLQLYQLKDYWSQFPRFWVTQQGGDTDSLLQNETKYYGYFPEQRNFINALKNTLLAIKILVKEKPDILISTGAGIAPPFFFIAKLLFRCKLIYIEPIDFIKFPTLTGIILHRFVDLMIIQNPVQKKFFRNATYWGKTL